MFENYDWGDRHRWRETVAFPGFQSEINDNGVRVQDFGPHSDLETRRAGLQAHYKYRERLINEIDQEIVFNGDESCELPYLYSELTQCRSRIEELEKSFE